MNDILLLLTSSCRYALHMLQFIALIGSSLQTSYINGVSLYVKFLYPFLSVIQLSVQTHFLVSVSAIYNSGQKLSTTIQAMTFFIGTVSVAQWWLIAIAGGGGRTRLPKFKFSAKFPIGLHVILQTQITKIRK